MNAGPRCEQAFDLALTELQDGYLVRIATEAGARTMQFIESRSATEPELAQAAKLEQRAVDQMGKRFEAQSAPSILKQNLEHPHWDNVAERCLSCANCTMVCPTCFCSSVQEVSDLEETTVERQRQWDSCFNLEFGYTAGGTVRNDRRSRYRQWLTHKLSTWHEQFGSSGCVGCGRCITWCPVGIDLTEEVAALSREPSAPRRLPLPKKSADICRVAEDDPA